jgi:hypothetical protein
MKGCARNHGRDDWAHSRAQARHRERRRGRRRRHGSERAERGRESGHEREEQHGTLVVEGQYTSYMVSCGNRHHLALSSAYSSLGGVGRKLAPDREVSPHANSTMTCIRSSASAFLHHAPAFNLRTVEARPVHTRYRDSKQDHSQQDHIEEIKQLPPSARYVDHAVHRAQ